MLLVCLVSPDLLAHKALLETVVSLDRLGSEACQDSKDHQDSWDSKDPKVRWVTEGTEGPWYEGLKDSQDLLVFPVSQGSLVTVGRAAMGSGDHLVSLGNPAFLGLLAIPAPTATVIHRLVTSRLAPRWTTPT